MAHAAPSSSRSGSGVAAGGSFWTDRRVEVILGALASLVLLLILGMVVFVFNEAWPSFARNGLGWFGDPPGDSTIDQQIQAIFNSPANPAAYVYEVSTWPLIWGTVVTTLFAVAVGLAFSLLAAVFIVEFAPRRLRTVLEPVVRLLAAVPSVIYGLIGILVLVPFLGSLISEERKRSVLGIVNLDGSSLLVAVLILTVMITPIMIAIIVDALRSIPRPWTEGAAALGVNRSRVMWTISVRAARPAIIAAVVLATARALGEAIMLSMVSGSVGFPPNPIDGLTFFLEPTRPLAATIVDYREGLSNVPFGQTIYAFAAVLLLSAMFLSLGGWAAKQPLKRYGMRV